MKCQRCGVENAINRIYCDECGAELEHDVTEIRAAVDQEIRADKARATARTIRWFLGVAFILFVVGIYFRRAYKNLPANDIVAFVTAPTVELSELQTIATKNFGVPLPELRPISKPTVRRDPRLKAKAEEQAYELAAVSIRQKGGQEVRGLLTGDLVFYFATPGEKLPRPVHIADVRALRPLGNDIWEITARGLKEPIRAPIPNAKAIKIKVLQQGAKEATTVPLAALEEIKPL